MDNQRCLVLNKTDWDRLKTQAGENEKRPEDVLEQEKREYLKAMDERSRQWKQNWPDTIEGVLKNKERSEKNERKKNEAFIKAFRESEEIKKRQNLSAVAEAKEKIFNSSSYGQELKSALLESKVIEEREAQIEFRKVIAQHKKEQEDALQNKIASMSNNLYNYSKKDEEATMKRKQETEKLAKINKITHEKLAEKLAKSKLEEQQLELEDARLMKQLLDSEKHETDKCKEEHTREYEQYLQDQKAFREAKLERDRLDDKLTKVFQKYQDKVRCQEKLVWQKIINDKFTSNEHKKVYEVMQNAQENENKAYQDFVNKGIEKAKERVLKEDEIHEKKKEEALKQKIQMQADHRAEEAKKLKQHRKTPNNRTCTCSHKIVDAKAKETEVTRNEVQFTDTKKPIEFLAPRNKLLEALKKREKQPTEWTALKGSHQYFAEKANSTLKECKHKKMARKVVDNYRKTTGMDATALPIPNY